MSDAARIPEYEENGRYISTSYRENACISVTVLPGLNIDLQTLWAVIK